MLKADYWRGLDFTNVDDQHHVTIIGAGSIGSYTAFCLARMFPKIEIEIWDGDVVEPHNLPNQLFADNINENIFKVFALQNTIKAIIADANIKVIPSMWNGEPIKCKCLVVAVDNMITRERLVNDYHVVYDYLLDARVGGLYANTFWSYKTMRELYCDTLYKDTQVKPLPCTGQNVVDVAMQVSARLGTYYRTLTKYGIGALPYIHEFHDFGTCQSYGMKLNPKYTGNLNMSLDDIPPDSNNNISSDNGNGEV